MDDEECEIGARCIAAPIRDYTGNVVASMSVSGSVSRMTREKIEVIKVYLKDVSNNISEKMAFKDNKAKSRV